MIRQDLTNGERQNTGKRTEEVRFTLLFSKVSSILGGKKKPLEYPHMAPGTHTELHDTEENWHCGILGFSVIWRCINSPGVHVTHDNKLPCIWESLNRTKSHYIRQTCCRLESWKMKTVWVLLLYRAGKKKKTAAARHNLVNLPYLTSHVLPCTVG